MNENLIERVDQTIEAVCKCIKSRTERNVNAKEIPEMTNALAVLITARANAVTLENRTN